MFEYLQHQENKQKIAIICVGYNRIKSMKRLLGSLLNAEYPSNDIPLIISIDCSGDEELYNFVRDFEWPYGEKYVNIQKERLGLRNHIYQCGDLSQYFKAIILLEDDLFVSPYFYHYAEQAIDKYGDVEDIAEISLYRNDSNGYAGFPFSPMQNGADVFLWHDVSTWGEIWTPSMWKSFVYWRDYICSEDIIKRVDMPDRIKGWTRAWSKYYNAYVISTGKHVLYPYVSLSTNFSDAGEHGGDSKGEVQVDMMYGKRTYIMPSVRDLVRYDIYDNNEAIPEWIGYSPEDLCVDLYGINTNIYGRRYILSSRCLPYKVLKSYALCMRPIEMNIKYSLEGTGLYLYDTTMKQNVEKKGSYSNAFMHFMMHGIAPHEIWKYTRISIINSIKRRLHL